MNVLNRVTMKTLRRNRARTVVTIIGVILSAAMFTAVTTFISTMQHYMLASVLSTQGSWHAQLAGLPYDAAGQLRDDPKIKAVAVQQEIGYARLPESQNDYKPYWYIQALDDGSAALLGIRLVEGRMPQNAGELLVPEHVLTSGGVAVKAGDTLTLSVGDRLADDGSPLTQTNPYNEEEPETIRIRETKAYTVVGICSRPSLEPYSAPGFTAFSALDTAALASDSPVILTFEARHIRDTAALAERYADAFRPSTTALHDSLLDFSGSSSNSAFNAVLYSMGAVLMGLILIGSVSLIYNAFAISVSERSKQFGMLAGVGATSRQIRGSVFFEAGFIGLIGVPVGILSGIAGIGVTLFFLGDAFASMNMAAGASAKFELSVSPGGCDRRRRDRLRHHPDLRLHPGQARLAGVRHRSHPADRRREAHLPAGENLPPLPQALRHGGGSGPEELQTQPPPVSGDRDFPGGQHCAFRLRLLLHPLYVVRDRFGIWGLYLRRQRLSTV